MRANIHPIWIVIATASAVSCTALLGLSDKTFDGTGGSGGSGASGSGMSSSLSATTSTNASSSSGMPPGAVVWAINSSTSAGMGDPPEISGVVVDGKNNIWITGTISRTTTFDGCNPLMVTGPAHYAFWAKLDQKGTCLTYDVYGNSSADVFAKSIAVGSSGDIVIVGGFTGTFMTPKGPLTSVGSDVFVIQLQADLGGVTWSKSFGGTADAGGVDEEATSVAIGSNDEIIVGGNYKGVFMNTTAKNGSQDMFLLRLNAAGTLIDHEEFGSIGDDSLKSISVAKKNGDIALTGRIGWAETLGTIMTCPISPMIAPSAFAALLSADGSKCTWAAYNAQNLQATATSIGNDIAFNNAEDHLAVVGEFTDLLTLGASSVGANKGDPNDGFAAAVPLLPPPAGSIALQKLGQKPTDTIALDHLNAVAFDPGGAGDAIMAGLVADTATFQNALVQAPGKQNIFVAKLPPKLDGSVTWIRTFGTSGSLASASAVTVVPPTGEVIVAGTFTGPINLSSSYMLNAAPGASELFVMKLTP